MKMAEAITRCIVAGVNFTKKMSGADFGAGTGLVTLELAKRVKHITAIDSSAGMLDMLKEKAAAGSIDNVSTETLDIENDPVGLKGLDFIVSSMAIHHVEDTAKMAAIFYGMLKPAGIAALADLEKEDGSFHNSGNTAGVKHHGFDRAVLTSVLQKAGFKNIRFTTAYAVERRDEKGENRSYPIFLLLAEK
jgi:ubiquinone/menaquinone biosynthesis C-methylase UbiE